MDQVRHIFFIYYAYDVLYRTNSLTHTHTDVVKARLKERAWARQAAQQNLNAAEIESKRK